MPVLSDVRKRTFLLLGIMIKYFFSNLLITSSDHDIYDAVFHLMISGRITTRFSFVSRVCTGKAAPVQKAKPIRYSAADPSPRSIAYIRTCCGVKSKFSDGLLMVWRHVAMLLLICF